MAEQAVDVMMTSEVATTGQVGDTNEIVRELAGAFCEEGGKCPVQL